MAFFDKFNEKIGVIPAQYLRDFAGWVSSQDARQYILERNEFCFEKAGLLICPLHQAEKQNDSLAQVEPILKYISSLDLPGLRGRSPFRIEVSILVPGAEVLEHQDQHLMHLLCERVHVPIISDGSACFYSRWFTQESWTPYQMELGSLYRLNNRVPHRVNNASPKHRVHVIIDYLRDEDFERYAADLNELDDRYMITSTSDAYWYRT